MRPAAVPALTTAPALWLLAAAALACLLLALALGSTAIGVPGLLAALRGEDAGAAAVIFDLRLPRALAAFAAGGLLALSGAVLQALLRNPLADPYVLGISGGAALAALLALAAGAGTWATQAASAAGALVSLLLLLALARQALLGGRLSAGDESTTAVLLTGAMLAAVASALIALLLSLAPDGRLRPMIFWLMGDLSAATQLAPALVACATLAGLALLARTRAPALNLLMRGDGQALTQGVPVARVRRQLVVIAALATAVAVTLGGAIGFVGFVVPHLLRPWLGNDQRLLLPASVLAGGALVVLADTLARTVAAPVQLPVGVVTALLGVPVFLWLMRRR
jgi:iron complex transport system permease protein